MTRAEHHVQLTSFGGVGTSFVQTFLKNEGLSLPTEPDCGIWKHMRTPPGTPGHPGILVPEDFRAIYLVGDPVAAVLSVFVVAGKSDIVSAWKQRMATGPRRIGTWTTTWLEDRIYIAWKNTLTIGPRVQAKEGPTRS